MVALILANGDQPTAGLLADRVARSDLFIATDGAADRIPAGCRAPDVVLGDFDSIDPVALAGLSGEQVVRAFDQDYSDLEKAIRYVIERGATSVVLAGVLGGRLDHELVAVALMTRYSDRTSLVLVHDGLCAWWIQGSHEFAVTPGDTVSLVAFQPVSNVSISGTEWPLSHVRIEPGSHGVSNRAASNRVTVSASPPGLLVLHLEAGRP